MEEELEALREEIEAAGGTAHVYSADLSDMDAINDIVVARMLADHPAIDFLVNNAGRSIRRWMSSCRRILSTTSSARSS